MQYSSEVPANSCDICTHSLENVKTVSKNVPKQLRKTVMAASAIIIHIYTKLQISCYDIFILFEQEQ